MNISIHHRYRAKGVVLLLAMIFLLLLATLSGTAVQTSILEFQMAGNDQFREEAFQRAWAIASVISSNADNFSDAGGVGHRVCKPGDMGPDCSKNSVIVLNTILPAMPPGVNESYRVERMGPKVTHSLPFRLSQASVSSSLAYNTVIFETWVKIDGGSVNLGSAEVVEGVALLVASSPTEAAE